jgi:hypothetical protein
MISEVQVAEGKMEREEVDGLLKTKDGIIHQHSDVCIYVGRKPL